MDDELSNHENTSSEVDMENINLIVTFLIILQRTLLELFDRQNQTSLYIAHGLTKYVIIQDKSFILPKRYTTDSKRN